MPQGNAAFSLMPPPFYMYRMVVAKARAPEESIQDQIDKIPDEVISSTNRYKIEVMPGIYPEVITMKSFVDVVAPYGRVVIQPDTGNFGVKMASNSMLQGVEVDLTTIKAISGATGIVIEAAKTNVVVEDVWVTGGTTDNIGIRDENTDTGATVIIRKCRIDSAETGYKKTGVAGITWLADCRITSADNGIDVDVDAGNLNLMDNELMGTGTGANVDVAAGTATINVYSFGNTLNGDGWQIGSNPNAWVYSHNDKFTKVTHAGDGHMVATEEPQTYRVHNGMKIGDALIAIAALSEGPLEDRRFTIQVFSGEYNEAVEMAQYVDLVGESNQSVVIYQASGAMVIKAANNSRIKGVRVEVTEGNGYGGIWITTGVNTFLEDLVIKITAVSGTANYGIYASSSGGASIYNCDIYATGVNCYAGFFSGSGTHYIYDSIFQSADLLQDIRVDGTVTIHSYNNKLRGNGWRIGDNSGLSVLSYGDDYPSVYFVGTAGLFADLTGCRLYDCADTINIGDWVYCDSNDHVDLADSDDIAELPSIGRVVYKPGGASGTTCYVKNYGYAYDANANSGHGDLWVAGTEFWIDGGLNAGKINDSMPPVWQQMAGVAVSTQRFKIIIGDVLGWAHINEYLNASGAVAVDDWVYITGTNDTVAKADASAAATMPAIGVVCELILPLPSTHCRVKLRGKWSQIHAGPWTAGDDVYVSETTGDITRIPPVMGVVQKVAEVKSYSDTTLMLEIAD